jgi:hypothetical protein
MFSFGLKFYLLFHPYVGRQYDIKFNDIDFIYLFIFFICDYFISRPQRWIQVKLDRRCKLPYNLPSDQTEIRQIRQLRMAAEWHSIWPNSSRIRIKISILCQFIDPGSKTEKKCRRKRGQKTLSFKYSSIIDVHRIHGQKKYEIPIWNSVAIQNVKNP